MNNDLISRSALLETFCNECGECGRCRIPCVDYDQVAQAPAVDAEMVRHGYWKPVMRKDVFGREFIYRHACSICCEYALHECANYDAEEELSNYCPNCGAKMAAEVQDVD